MDLKTIFLSDDVTEMEEETTSTPPTCSFAPKQRTVLTLLLKHADDDGLTAASRPR